jgi:hypothetical protein
LDLNEKPVPIALNRDISEDEGVEVELMQHGDENVTT